MAVLGVQIRSLEARRFQEPQANQQVRVDHNSGLTNVAADGERLRVDFSYTTSYGALGIIKVEGALLLAVDRAADLATAWGKDRHLPPETAQMVHGAIMAACMPQAVGLAKELRLPTPIPLPQVRFQGQQAQAKSNTSDPYSPEIG